MHLNTRGFLHVFIYYSFGLIQYHRSGKPPPVLAS